ncbi:hypothetical protein [Hymenobacter crusticola]|uniref:Outer membrane protein beta-barrel domain-containing protein n=1 Tax=Hymenobacter crusticola TaxID=1770526 RepID=A0A243WJY3_9BACT|nr:hypothetical protein [Hymenobacter crusticola]OUJ76203.1 hypothetical protein BXP70_02750 [Hymenobacter crusticola]
MRPHFNALLILALCLLATAAQAQNDPTPDRHGPFFLTVQIGGGQGLVAVGGGFWLADQKLEPEVLVGYVPPSVGGRAMAIFTLKTTYTPYSPSLQNGWQVSPVSIGGFVNYTTGEQFFLTNQSAGRYPKGYYWWSPAVRIGALVGARITHEVVGNNLNGLPRRTTLYGELSTNDLHLVSKFTNKSLSLPEILTLGLGLKAGGR